MIGSKATQNLPDIDESERRLQDPFTAQFFRPRRPKFTAEGVCNEEYKLSISCFLHGDSISFWEKRNNVAVNASIKVHGRLDSEDGGQNNPFFLSWKTEAEDGVTAPFCKLDFRIAGYQRLKGNRIVLSLRTIRRFDLLDRRPC